ncbi:MAG: hypothetical protein ACUVSX_03430 [Aggregatilineales bacterium]
MHTLATLHALRLHLGLGSADSADDARLAHALRAASVHLERLAGRRFSPRREAIVHRADRRSRTLLLRDDLLALAGLTDAVTGQPIPLASVVCLPEGGGPFYGLRRADGAAFPAALTVEGVWGWHDRWAEAWTASGDAVQNNPLAADAATISVQDADGPAADGASPRFQAGQLLRVGDEYLRLLAVDAQSNTLTTARGAHGTAAAAHSSGSTIAVYRTAPDVELLCLRWAAWLYREPDAAPAAFPPALLAALEPLRRSRI